MAYVKVDIKHSSGESESGHVVELAKHSSRTVAEQVEDHLRCRHTKSGIRGGWTYANLQTHTPSLSSPKTAQKPLVVDKTSPKADA